MLPEEHRIAGLLQELIAQSGTTLEVLERRLGWEPRRLKAVLEGHLRLSFEDVLKLLPLLGATPVEFFRWLYGFSLWDSSLAFDATTAAVAGPARQRALDRLFERSLRAVKTAVARRSAAKK